MDCDDDTLSFSTAFPFSLPLPLSTAAAAADADLGVVVGIVGTQGGGEVEEVVDESMMTVTDCINDNVKTFAMQ